MLVGAATVGLTSAMAAAALAAFPQSAPNDPAYAPTEEGGPETCLQQSVNDEQRYLYGFMPRCAPLASDPENASGMSIGAGPNGEGRSAWRDFTIGRSDTVLAYVEGGINWHYEPEELANRVFLNRGELPEPTTRTRDGAFNAEDYADTPDANRNGLVDPEDIIVRFSNGEDEDGNGYTDDISGWDFYNDQNDPATVDSAYEHANNQMWQAAAETNNGTGEAGICPKCMLLPIKAGAEALDRTDDLAEAWLYAGDMGADVLISVTADLGYSSFMRQAVERNWDRGVVMVQASNDFNSTDHQGGMWWPHVLPGNGLVSNSQGIPGPAANELTTTYRARSGITSWGTHNVFSVATGGGSTSESTPTLGGVMGLVISYGTEAARKGLVDHPLTGHEAIQVVRATSSDISGNPNPPTGWRGNPGFDLQYGYGRPNVYEAMEAISAGEIPPVAWIDAPRWYSLHDPARRSSVPVRGHVDAPRSSGYRWRLQFAPGPDPSEAEFMTAASGAGNAPLDGRLGEIDLGRIPQSFWSRRFKLSETKALETNERYTVTLRLRVTDAAGRIGEDRRTIAVHHDADWRPGTPKRIGPSGESPASLVDLQGRGRLAAVFGDTDGRLHALDGRTMRELPGFPVTTRPTRVEREHRGIDPGHEPLLTGQAVGDLLGNGRLEIVAASTTGRVYVWDDHGELLPGWPKTLATGVVSPDIPRQKLPFTRSPVRGSGSPPVLYDLDDNGRLEILQSGWDGRLHVWRADGRPLPGWPVKVTLPPGHQPPSGQIVIRDQKLDTPPAIADLDGDGEPEIVIRSQYSDTPGADVQPNGRSHVHAYEADGAPVPGFPIEAPAIIVYYNSGQEFITEGISIPTIADVDGDGDDEIAFAAGIFSPTFLYDGDGSPHGIYGPLPEATRLLLEGDLEAKLDALDGDLPTDAPVNFTTFGAFGRFGPASQLTYAEPGSGGATAAAALLTPGSGVAINNYLRAYDARTGAAAPGFPSELQGLDFLGAPVIADLTGDRRAEIAVGADSSAMHAYGESGEQAGRFPKFTSGWNVFGPTAGDLDSDGRTDLVAAAREGYLFAWETSGAAGANQEWWAPRHDEWNTGRYGVDSRPPGVLRELRFDRRRGVLAFIAPGDDWYAGRVDRYVVRPSPLKSHRATVRAGRTERIPVPREADRVSVYAVDEAGNRGRAATIRVTGARR